MKVNPSEGVRVMQDAFIRNAIDFYHDQRNWSISKHAEENILERLV